MVFLGGILYFAGTMGEKLIQSLTDIKISVDKNSNLVIKGNNLIEKLIDLEFYKQGNKKR